MTVNEKIAALRALMKQKKIDVYYVPNEDDHLSAEYTATYFQCKSWLSGFSGESGCLVVTDQFAGLWTDGRYFTQAENELAGTCVQLMRLAQAGVPDPLDYLVDAVPAGGVLGFDGKVVSAANARRLSERLAEKRAKILMNEDLAGLVWGEERPKMPMDKLYVLAKKYTGEDAATRIARVREAMKANHADVLVLTHLEDPCWMLNVRGNDIECTPVVYAFALVSEKKVNYYVDEKKVPAAVKRHLKEAGVTLCPYTGLGKDLSSLRRKTIWADLKSLNASLFARIDAGNTVLNASSPIELFRGVKNAVEVKNTIAAHVKDGVAMVKFIYWIKNEIQKSSMTEVQAQDELYRLRALGAHYISPSFGTICAYKENGAMMHYSAKPGACAKIKPSSFLLVDSGGTYSEGTTDITRTIAMGKLSKEEKMMYTKVLKGHIDLSMARFLRGTCGNNLDILARGPIWDMNLDYQCGTGHGVGHVLSVHEGPQSIRWGQPSAARPQVALEPGMIVTNEPGIYLPHKIGIRIENELLVCATETNFYGQFLHFDTITFCPYETDAIDVNLLNEDELKWLNDYHKMVYDTLNPYLSMNEKEWLRSVTKALKK